MEHMWKKKIVLVVITSVATFVIAMLAAEVYLRHTQTSPAPSLYPDDVPYALELYTHDGRKVSPLIGSLKLSLAPFTVYQNLPSQQTAAFTINSRGLRAAEGVEHDPAPKVILLGGSSAFGFGVRTDQETISYLLEQSIKSHRVINAGVTGFLSGQELTYLVTDLIDYRPDLVVVYDGWNDLFEFLNYSKRKTDSLGFNRNFFALEDQLVLNYQTQENSSRGMWRLMGTASRKSLVLSRFVQALRARQNRAASIQPLAGPSGIGGSASIDAVVASYVSNIRKMSLFSHACDAEFIVVFQPELGQRLSRTPDEERLLKLATEDISTKGYQDAFPPLYREFLGKAKQLLTRDGVEWIDVNESDAFQQNSDSLFVDLVHTNRRGNETVVKIISPRLKQLAESRYRRRAG